MRRMTYFVMALALVLGFTQCKKEQPTTQDETQGVRITLYVEDSGNKHEVVPGTGAVNFEDSDVIYVGNGSTYIGTLTRNEDVFSGNITEPADGTEIYFYFVGGLTTAPADLSGQSSFTVNISNQTTKLSVLSLNQATYRKGVTDYSCELKNQCGLVKFRTNVASGTVSVGGMNTVATITFGSNTITAGTSGAVSFATDGDGEGWAILLMQDGVDEATVTADGYFDGKCNVPEITRNMWYEEGVEVSLESEYVDLGLPSGLLWATCNVGADTPEGYGDYFAWGETQPKDTYTSDNYTYSDNPTELPSEHDAATANWGSDWRMPTWEEWAELLSYTNITWTTQNGVNGQLFTAKNNSGNSIFLPAAGYRVDGSLNSAGSEGYYWSSMLENSNCANDLYIESGWEMGLSYSDRSRGQSVRAVRSAPQN